jgi:hypothetical protein
VKRRKVDRAECRGYLEQQRTGLRPERLPERPHSTGGLKGTPCGWGDGWSLTAERFRSLADS